MAESLHYLTEMRVWEEAGEGYSVEAYCGCGKDFFSDTHLAFTGAMNKAADWQIYHWVPGSDKWLKSR